MQHNLPPFVLLGKHEVRWYCHAMRSLPAAIRLLGTGACAVLLASCQISTPMSRVSQNPVIYQTLSPEHQSLVQQGLICEGMSKEAVFLAWGNPNSAPVIGQQNGVPYEKWVYVVYQPVMMDAVGVGAWCWHGGVAATAAYVPREAAWVMFEQDKVTSW